MPSNILNIDDRHDIDADTQMNVLYLARVKSCFGQLSNIACIANMQLLQ